MWRCGVVSYCYIRASTYLHTLSPVSALLIRSNSSRQGRHHSTVLRTGRGLLIAPPSTLLIHLHLHLEPSEANDIGALAGGYCGVQSLCQACFTSCLALILSDVGSSLGSFTIMQSVLSGTTEVSVSVPGPILPLFSWAGGGRELRC